MKKQRDSANKWKVYKDNLTYSQPLMLKSYVLQTDINIENRQTEVNKFFPLFLPVFVNLYWLLFNFINISSLLTCIEDYY